MANPAEQGARDVAELTNEPLPGTDLHRDRKAGLRYAIRRGGYSWGLPGVVGSTSPTTRDLMQALEASLVAARRARRDETAAG